MIGGTLTVWPLHFKCVSHCFKPHPPHPRTSKSVQERLGKACHSTQTVPQHVKRTPLL